MLDAHKKLLQDFKESPYAIALSAYLEDEMKKIESVKGVKSLDEALGKQYAIELLEKLFNFLQRKTTLNNKPNYE